MKINDDRRKEKMSEVKDLLLQHEEKMRPVDERLKNISFRDVDTNAGMFLNQPLLALNVKIKDREDFENVLRTVEKMSLETTDSWKIFHDFPDRFLNKIIIPEYNRETGSGYYEYDCFKDKSIMDFALASKNFCYFKILEGGNVRHSALDYFLSSEHCPEILKSIRPDFFDLSMEMNDKFENWIKNLETIRDELNLNSLEFSSLVANSFSLVKKFNDIDLDKIKPSDIEELKELFYEENILERILAVKGIDKDVFDYCFSRNESINSLAFMHQVDILGVEQFKSQEIYYTLEEVLEYIGSRNDATDNPQMERMTNELIDFEDIPDEQDLDDYLFDKTYKQKKVIDKRYAYDIKSNNVITHSPRFLTAQKAIKKLVAVRGIPEEVTNELLNLGGTVLDERSFSQTTLLSEDNFNLNYLILSSEPPKEMNDLITNAYLAATFPAICPKIIDNINLGKAFNKYQSQSLEINKFFSNIYLDAGGSYEMLLNIK